jgi:hypothetical protein
LGLGWGKTKLARPSAETFKAQTVSPNRGHQWLVFRKNTINVDIHTHMITHSYKYIYVYPYSYEYI